MPLLLSVVLVISLAITYTAWDNAKQNMQDVFDYQVKETLTLIKHRMDTYDEVLHGAQGLFAASKEVERSEFKAYVDTLELKRDYPGIKGIGFSVIVPKASKTQHIAEIRKQGLANYRLWPEGEREDYTAIIYLEPLQGQNLQVIGYDMYSEPIRRAALQKARDFNRTEISGKVKLLQETNANVQAGFLMYLPVYKPNLPHTTLAERRNNIIGWVYAPFRMGDFMGELNLHFPESIHVEIYDGHIATETAMMFDSDHIANSCNIFNSAIQKTVSLKIKNHIWTVFVCSTPWFESSLDKQKPQIIAITGVFLSLLLTLVIGLLLSRLNQALRLATKMTHELVESEQRFRMMANSVPMLIWVAETDKLCSWFNKTWLDFTGRTLEQELGNGWTEGVHPDDFQRCLDYYVSHFDRHQAFEMEYKLRRYDGEYRWILDSGIPRFNQQGDFAGFIGSCLDITERKQMESALIRSNADLTRFAEVSAHHLMEPSRRLNSYTQRLARLFSLTSTSAAQSTNTEINDCLGYLQGDAMHLHQMVRDIQRYLIAAEPRGVLQFEQVSNTLSQIKKTLLSRANRLNRSLITQNLPPVFLDYPRLLDLFSLILDNALLHGQPTNPDVAPQIVINGERLGKLSRYSISDNGAGIPPVYHERVFEIFERLRQNNAAGSGIGLAIARKIVESRQGKIWIENSKPSGTTVIFEIPDGEQ